MKNLEMIKVAFIGSVDDGKSSLIGRIFHDRGSIFENQKDEIARSSKKQGVEFNLALFTDGLKSEREQGITIDIAYRFLLTNSKRFIIIDCPGHETYLRNMVTGCSQAHAVVVLVDAKNGITDQTRRHLAITSMLQIPHLIFAINKMDLVHHDQNLFQNMVSELQSLLPDHQKTRTQFVPISATLGTNVIQNDQQITWYSGPGIFEAIDSLKTGSLKPDSPSLTQNHQPFRFQVQRSVFLPHSDLGQVRENQMRGYAGRVLQGEIRTGDTVYVGSTSTPSKIIGIHSYDNPQQSLAQENESVTLSLQDNLDCSRGDFIFSGEEADKMVSTDQADALLYHLSTQKITAGSRLILKRGAESIQTKISALEDKEFAKAKIKLQKKTTVDAYTKSKQTGSFVLIHPVSHETLAIGLFA